MTALAGYWRADGVSGDAERTAERMLRAQAVYAPDAPSRCHADGRIALGRRLNRRLPEDAFDTGPVVDAAGRVLVADVRLDNREELGRALGIDAADARRLSDVAILSRCLAHWDEAALDRIVGDFAFAWWDPSRRRLLLARDFLGQRPLHYHHGRGLFAFASMPKGLHALPQVPRAANAQAAADFLAHIPETGDESFFEGVAKVPPGHVVRIDPAGMTTRRTWTPDLSPLRLPSAAAYAEGLRERLDVAVASRLRGADGRVAAHLSGGLDSASVAATAARLLDDAGHVTAYTSVPREGFAGGRRLVDEGPLAAGVAAFYPNMEHVRIRAGATSPLDALGRNAFLYERPYLNLCNGVWIDAINDDAKRRGLHVMLTGSAGNAGFSFDGMPRFAELLRGGRLPALAREAVLALRRGTGGGTIAAATIGPFLPHGIWSAINRVRGRGDDLASYSAIRPAAADAALAARAAARGVDFGYRPRRDAREGQMWLLGRVDFGNYNKGQLGGWGLDVRDPTADRRLVEYCLRVPADQYLSDGVPRALARRAMTDRLPDAITRETRKGYQGADWYEGLSAARDQLRAEIAGIARDPAAARLIDVDRLARLVDDWPTGSWTADETIESYRLATLRGVSMGHFMRTAAGTN